MIGYPWLPECSEKLLVKITMQDGKITYSIPLVNQLLRVANCPNIVYLQIMGKKKKDSLQESKRFANIANLFFLNIRADNQTQNSPLLSPSCQSLLTKLPVGCHQTA